MKLQMTIIQQLNIPWVFLDERELYFLAKNSHLTLERPARVESTMIKR